MKLTNLAIRELIANLVYNINLVGAVELQRSVSSVDISQKTLPRSNSSKQNYNLLKPYSFTGALNEYYLFSSIFTRSCLNR